MGRSIKSKYKLEIRNDLGRVIMTPMCWFVKDKGKPTRDNLIKYVKSFNESLKPGGVNEHLAKAYGIEEARIDRARISENVRDGAVIAEYKVYSGNC